MENILITILILAAINSYIMLSLSDGNWLSVIGNKISIKCEPCRCFWVLAFPQAIIWNVINQTMVTRMAGFSYEEVFKTSFYIALAFPIAALSIMFYRFIKN